MPFILWIEHLVVWSQNMGCKGCHWCKCFIETFMWKCTFQLQTPLLKTYATLPKKVTI